MSSEDPTRTLRTPPYKEEGDECVIPGAMPIEALGEYILAMKGDETEEIRSYVEWQASDEKVKHLEKVKTEYVFGQRTDAWDVITDKDRWWVITNPTNLYAQRLFPSLDYTLSFHIGLMTRVAQAEMTEEQEFAHENVNELWNPIARTRSALFAIETTEDFRAIGVRCREILLRLVGKLSSGISLPPDLQPPQRGNFVAWTDILADTFAAGASNARLRSYLKAVAKTTWQLTNWLTHSQSAERHDCSIAIEATENVVTAFMTAWAKASKSQAEPPGKEEGVSDEST